MHRNYDNGQLTTPISARLTQNRSNSEKGPKTRWVIDSKVGRFD